jgi:hypothetical protein
MLMTFDGPDSTVCSVRRERSNTPLQALTLMNDVTFVECARALGLRLAAHPADTAGRLTHAFRLCLARDPSSQESRRLAALHDELLALCRKYPDESRRLLGDAHAKNADALASATWVAMARVIMNLDEFVTRE